MRLRTLLATSVAGTLLAGTAGVIGAPAHATRAPSPNGSGSVVAWGDTENPMSKGAIEVPTNLSAPVADISTTLGATGVVTTDGKLRVWGGGPEVLDEEDAAAITDAVAVSLTNAHGAVLHSDGKITAWGDIPEIEDVPSDLRAKAIAVTAGGTGYAVRTNGTLTTWGTPLDVPIPVPAEDLTNLVDVAAGLGGQVLVLRADGKVFAWGQDPDPESPWNIVPDLGGKKVTQISTGGTANGVLLEDGTIKVWGDAPLEAAVPAFAGKKVISLSIGAGFIAIAGAVTEDGAVHTWSGAPADAVNTHPASLAGQPGGTVVVGMFHAAAIVVTLRDLTKPAITGTPQVGQTLTAKPATFNVMLPTPAAGQWYADAAPITGQTGTTLVLDQAVVGKKISYRSTATRSGQTVTSTSNELGPVTAVVKPPVVKAKSTVSAKAKASGKAKKVAKKVTITVTVKTTKGVSPAGKVTITLKGKTKKKVTATVNAKGKATATVKKVKRGKYKAQLSYAGNDKVAASSATAKFKI